ncbi:MAG: four helix bundle protein [Lentimonas sp.]|jgi:four helix bundle protein
MSNPIADKSFDFACKIVQFRNVLVELKHYEVASQIIRSGTSIGANVREAQRAESKVDFRHKLRIALKEADETKYWLEVIDKTITEVPQELFFTNEELIKLLVSIIKNTKVK